MEMTGEHRINASRAAVWAGLNDPDTLKQSIAGCEDVNRVSDTELTAHVTAKVGPVKAKFGGKITLSDLDPPNGYTLSGEGQGGAAGFAKGAAKVRLEDAPGGGTMLKYDVKAQIGGKLAQIGSRLIDGTARKMADEFFVAFAAAVEAKNAGAAPAAISPGSTTGEPSAAEPVMQSAAVPAPVVAPVASGARKTTIAWLGAGAVVICVALYWGLAR